jgi:hypothetical protein
MTNDSMILLAVLCIGMGLYITHLHSVIRRYRAWSKEASNMLLSLAMSKAADEYGFDLEERDDET